MSAETLRRAAALMRERAEACKAVFGGEFTVTESTPGRGGWPFILRNGAEVLSNHLDRADAEHIASWHPAVALAVADFVECIADRWDEWQPPPEVAADWAQAQRALAVARAYLGATA